MINTGVVIGHYNYPCLAELQINLIRYHNGAIPIFICDDFSSKSLKVQAYQKLMELTTRYADVTVWSNPQRLGHAGGDLVSFHLGIQWAYFRRLKYLVKLSQRMVLDIDQWIPKCTAALHKRGLAVGSETCIEGTAKLPVRTELVVMDTAKWYHPVILDRFRMQSCTGTAAEIIIGNVIDEFFDGEMAKLPLFGPDRVHPFPGVVWHCSHARGAYEALARRFGLTLSDHFTCAGWHIDPEYRM